jgi:hypothetical protein
MVGYSGILVFNGNKIITTSGESVLISDLDENMEKAIFYAI